MIWLTGPLILASISFRAAAADAKTEPADVLVLPKQVIEEEAIQSEFVNKAAAGPLGTKRVDDIPYSINVTPEEFMQKIQASTVRDALQYNPTLNSTSGMNSVGGGATFAIRGFNSSNKTVDGLRSPDLANIPVEDKAAIEVLNGPSSFLNGIGNPGGTLNFVTKKPVSDPLANLTLGFSGESQLSSQLDLGGALNSNASLAYRLNLLYVDDGETAINGQTNERDLETLALSWAYAPSSKVTTSLSHYQTKVGHGADNFSIQLGSVKKGGVTYTGLTAMPQVPDTTTNFMPKFSSALDVFDRFGISAVQQVADAVTVRVATAYTDCERKRHRAADLILDNQGDYWLSRNYYYQESFTTQGAAYLDARFQAAGWDHTLTLGACDDFTKVKYAYPYKNGNVDFGVYSLYHGTPVASDTTDDVVGRPNRTTQRINFTTYVLSDTINFNEKWSLLAGTTFARVLDRNWAYTTPTTFTAAPPNEKGRATPSAAVMYKPVPSLTTYVSYIEGLQEGGTAPSTAANANATLAPYVGRQVEAGVKVRLENILFTAAIFEIRQPYAFTDATDNVFKSAGTEVHRGAEFVVSGPVSTNLTISGGLSLIDASIRDVGSTTTTGVGGKAIPLADKRPSAVPSVIGRLFAEYKLPFFRDVAVNGGLSYTASEYVDAGNSLSIPGVVTASAGASYATRLGTHPLVLRLGVTNLTGKDYWVATGSGLAFGQPRAVFLSARLSWF